MRARIIFGKSWLALLTMLLLSAGWGACSSDDDDDDFPPEVTGPRMAKYQIMVVFDPYQLGDSGYADKVMEGVQFFSNSLYDDSAQVDVSFIADFDRYSMEEAFWKWATDSINPTYGNVYERRLLILTEHQQLRMLNEMADSLRPTDEVLALKVNDEDLDTTEASQKLGNRLHGANISAAYSIRRYCRFMDYIAGETEAKGGQIDKNIVHMLRLYDDSLHVYRDSIMEALTEMRGETLSISKMAMLAPDDELPYSSLFFSDVVSAATDLSADLLSFAALVNCPFCIIDLGSCNNTMDFAQMGNQEAQVFPLMIDGQAHDINGRFYVDRDFKILVSSWVSRWLQAPMGSMPRMECHGGWDGYCTDNLYGPIN